MKRTKRIACFIFAILMMITAFMPVVGAATASATSMSIPTIYVQGNKNTKIYNKDGKQIWPLTKSIGDAISERQSDVIRTGLVGISSGDWNPMATVIEEAIDTIFKDLRVNANGNVSNGSYIGPKVNDVKTDKDGKYELEQFRFRYDIRLDPLAVAPLLRDYVLKVLAATGQKKVNIVGRCMGTTIVAAYLTKYKSDPLVNTVVLYSTASNGVLIEEAPFSGELIFDSKSLSEFTATAGEDDLSSMLDGFIKFFGSKTVSKQLKDVTSKAMPVIMPRVLRKTYANFPSYWALLSDEYFNKCMNYIYGSKSLQEKYSGMLTKVKKTHTSVANKFDDTLVYLKDKKGVNINIITKYDKKFDSIYERNELQGDAWIEGSKQSFGGTFANRGKTLPTKTLEKLEAAGLGKYVSGDRIVDATTCLFPDYTWFIKGLTHGDWAKDVDILIRSICNKKTQVTVNTFSNYPQFLRYSNEKISILGNYLQTKKPKVGEVTLSTTSYAYDGNNKTPSVTVKTTAFAKLVKDRDYTVTYESSRSSIGKHYVTVKFIGDFKGTASKKLGYTIKPANVTGLTLTVKSATSASLSWEKVAGATYYKVYKYISSSKSWKILGTTKSTSYTAKGLTSGGKEKLAVRAFKDVNDAPYCSVKFVSAVANLKPATVTGVKVTPGTKEATIKWSKAGGAEMYQVFRSTSANGVYARVGAVTTTSFKNTGLTTGRTYYYKVRAVKVIDNKNVYSDFSTIVSGKIL